ncbi:MAG: hypothetical protein IJQ39_02935 [Thermoguttaceae bacterium]|nr:hypothetical protein [Thermoguttaceae bacterium]
MKNIFVAIGILAVILFIAVWQFGFFYNQVKDITTKIDRATAVDRATMMIEKAKRQADSLQERSREMKIKARTMELGVEREQESLAKVEFAVKQLAQTLKTAGLPKPSELGTLTDEQKQTKIVFGGNEGTAMDAYNQLGKWKAEYTHKKAVLDAKRNLIANQNAAADSMLNKQKELYMVIDKIKIQLDKLETEREIAAINKEMAELGATAEGVNVGDIGKILDTIQDEIDHLNATAEVDNKEAGKPTNGDVYEIPEIAPSSDNANSLDSYWD